jgi:tRNA modification GTPase
VRDNDTIAALATPAGTGAIAIVRLSGPKALHIAAAISGRSPSPRVAKVCEFRDTGGQTIDQGLMLAFPGPRSYTGEDVAELHGHGSAVVSDWLLETCYALGARAAEPGEFTLRAFLNDKLDLSQAEAVADLIASGSRHAARAALRSLRGEFSFRVAALQSELARVRTELEAHLDFPDEDITPEAVQSIEARIGLILGSIVAMKQGAQRGAMLNDGISVVIAGPPNAGKSSILNRLAGHDAAIVTDIAGTTRDALRERIELDGLTVNVIDTAGFRSSDDPIEREGLRRAAAELGRADHVLWVVDCREERGAQIEAARRALDGQASWTLVENKVDLVDGPAGVERSGLPPVLRMSALTGEGLDVLIEELKSVAGLRGEGHGAFSARRRHLDAIDRTENHLMRSKTEIGRAHELAAEELRAAQAALSELTGEYTSDDLLGEIFGKFCIGK